MMAAYAIHVQSNFADEAPELDAAMQRVSAFMKSRPVSVWLTVPFRFILKGN
jgi:hypothetical protein